MLRFSRHLQANQAPNTASTQQAQVVAGDGPLTWEGEPTCLDELTSRYHIEHKISARAAGASLFVCKSAEQDGQQRDVCDGQMYKLFIAS